MRCRSRRALIPRPGSARTLWAFVSRFATDSDAESGAASSRRRLGRAARSCRVPNCTLTLGDRPERVGHVFRPCDARLRFNCAIARRLGRPKRLRRRSATVDVRRVHAIRPAGLVAGNSSDGGAGNGAIHPNAQFPNSPRLTLPVSPRPAARSFRRSCSSPCARALWRRRRARRRNRRAERRVRRRDGAATRGGSVRRRRCGLRGDACA